MKPSLKKAFTFIEMLWVLCIVVILISISTIAFRHGQQKARDMVRKNDLQMIADALISYGNDHGHFPSSIYDENKPHTQVNSVVDALNKDSDLRNYKLETNGQIKSNINPDFFDGVLDEKYFTTKIEWTSGSVNYWASASQHRELKVEELENDANENNADTSVKQAAEMIEQGKNRVPVIKNMDEPENLYYGIITQSMCMSDLQWYLVGNWYLSYIPKDPSWESVKLDTNICVRSNTILWSWINANDKNWRINRDDCRTIGSTWCAQPCSWWYTYISDWVHFALIARMESKNNWNYETTACGSCAAAWTCGNSGAKPIWTDTDQLPCDITDEFTNTFDCIKNTGVVEYATWQYYFYIY